MIKNREECGLDCGWQTGQDVFDWWIDDKRGKKKDNGADDPDKKVVKKRKVRKNNLDK